MKTEVEENCMRACIFRIHGYLDEMFSYDGTLKWLLTPRENLDFRTPWAAIEQGEHERVLTMVENLAKVASPF